MSKSLVVHPTGSVEEVTLVQGMELELMYAWLGCGTVDVVTLTDQLDMWLDDEGMFRQPVNPLATQLAKQYGYGFQDYYGSALLCTHNADGESRDLTDDQLAAVRSHLVIG